MKRLLIFLLSVLSASSLYAQVESKGTDFVLSFARTNQGMASTPGLILQIRIVADEAASGTITFPEATGSERVVNFDIAANSAFTHTLTTDQKTAAYNREPGISNNSVFVNSDVPVSVYALATLGPVADATNILPIPTLGSEYYHLGRDSETAGTGRDQYLVIATQNGTVVYEDGSLAANLSAGQVYLKRATGTEDLSGLHIISNKPIAYFSAHSFNRLNGGADNIFQQLTPVNTWGTKFLVPVSNRKVELVRIIASQNNTKITHSGGRNVNSPYSPIPATVTLNAGQWVEWRITLDDNGCYIQSDKPIQVCSYMVGINYGSPATNSGDEGFVWIPPIEQSVKSALMAPFVSGSLNDHHVLVVTPTATKNNTTRSTGGGAPTPLSGGTWRDNATSGMSFYSAPIANSASLNHVFENPAGLIVYGYGFGYSISYYYMAGASVRNLETAFYVNDVHYQDLSAERFCQTTFNVRANIIDGAMSTNPGHLRWFINGTERTAVRDQMTWTMSGLSPGSYTIEMRALASDNLTTTSVQGVATVYAPIAPGTIAGNQTICSGNTPTALTSATPATGTVTYRWQQSTNSGSTWTNITGTAGAGVGYSPGAITTTTQYRRNATGIGCDGLSTTVSSNVVTVTVAAAMNGGVIAGNQSITSGNTPSALTSTTPGSGGTGTITYRWQSSPNNSTWTNITGAAGANATYAPGALAATTYYRRQATTSCGSATSNTVTITVSSANGDALITVNVPSTRICSGDPVSLPATATSVTGPTFRWYDAATGGTLLHTGATYTPSPTSTTTYHVSVSGTSMSESTRKAVTVTVTPVSTPAMIKITQ